MGLIAGGGDNGVISLWDPVKILRYCTRCSVILHHGEISKSFISIRGFKLARLHLTLIL